MFLNTSSLTYAVETISTTGAQPVVPGIKNDVEWTALAAVRPGNEDDM